MEPRLLDDGADSSECLGALGRLRQAEECDGVIKAVADIPKISSPAEPYPRVATPIRGGGPSRCRHPCVTAKSKFETCLYRVRQRARAAQPTGDFHAISISDVVPRRARRAGRGADRRDVGDRCRHRLSRRRHRHARDPCRSAAGRQRAARPRLPARARPGVAAGRRRCPGAARHRRDRRAAAAGGTAAARSGA